MVTTNLKNIGWTLIGLPSSEKEELKNMDIPPKPLGKRIKWLREYYKKNEEVKQEI